MMKDYNKNNGATVIFINFRTDEKYVEQNVDLTGMTERMFNDAYSVTKIIGKTIPQAVVVDRQKPNAEMMKCALSDHITCLDCGGHFKSLKRHLVAQHAEAPESYRVKWNLPADYPMIAPGYEEARTQLAKQLGFKSGNWKAW